MGGLILDPVLGMHSDVLMIDFKSFFPNLVEEYNLCPSTQTADSGVESPDHFWFTRDRPGVLPRLMNHFKQKRAEVRQFEEKNAFKLLANKLYGLLYVLRFVLDAFI